MVIISAGQGIGFLFLSSYNKASNNFSEHAYFQKTIINYIFPIFIIRNNIKLRAS